MSIFVALIWLWLFFGIGSLVLLALFAKEGGDSLPKLLKVNFPEHPLLACLAIITIGPIPIILALFDKEDKP